VSLLQQLRSELPGPFHYQKVFLTSDVAEAERIAARARELYLPSVRYLLLLDRFESRPSDRDPKQATFDILIGSLRDIEATLASMPVLQTQRTIEVGQDD